MSDLRDRIAAVLNRHKPDGDRYNEWSDCQCGNVGTRWDDHVADAVIRELGMTEFRVEHPVAERWWATKVEPLCRSGRPRTPACGQDWTAGARRS